MMKFGNIINIDGESNIVLQDIQNSTITINTSDELKKLILENNDLLINDLIIKLKSDINFPSKDLLNNPTEIKRLVENLTVKIPKNLSQIPSIDTNTIFGRQDIVKQINNLFEVNQIVAINGIGGIGKTTIAKLFLKTYENQYKHIIWLQFHKDNDFKSLITENSEIKTNLFINQSEIETQNIFSEIILRLNDLGANNILIIDDFDYISDFIINQLRELHWKILITTRMSSSFSNVAKFDIQPLTKDDIFTLFYSSYTIERNDKLLERLFNLLGYHPLSIKILANNAQKNKLTLIQIYEHVEKQYFETFTPNKLELIVNSFLDQLQSINSLERKLLNCFAILPSHIYTLDDITYFSNNYYSNKLNINVENLNSLVSCSWLIKVENKFKMHPLIQQTIIDKINPKFDINSNFDNFDIVNDIKDKISRNNLVDAIKDLKEYSKDKDIEIHNQIILTSSRYFDIQDQINLCLISYDNAQIIKNQIRNSILHIIDKLFNNLINK